MKKERRVSYPDKDILFHGYYSLTYCSFNKKLSWCWQQARRVY